MTVTQDNQTTHPRPKSDAEAIRAIEDAAASVKERIEQICRAPELHRPKLVTSPAAWQTFTASVKAGLPGMS